jgi:hypothetical protein
MKSTFSLCFFASYFFALFAVKLFSNAKSAKSFRKTRKDFSILDSHKPLKTLSTFLRKKVCNLSGPRATYSIERLKSALTSSEIL